MYTHATFISRINRFVAAVTINNIETNVYVPNTGRMSELALPGTECLLTESRGRYQYKILYMISNGFPVMIDSSLSNSLFAELLANRKVPGLEEYSLLQREPVYGRHRFDFLLEHENNKCYVELKSCTLFYGRAASFPDAVSDRASSHIEHLASTGCGRLIIFILNEESRVFIPNYHTDYNFYLTLKKYSPAIKVDALRIKYNSSLEITSLENVPVHIPDVSRSGFFFAAVISGSGMHMVYVSDFCHDVFIAVQKFRARLKQGITVPCIHDVAKIYDMPIIGLMPQHDEIHSIISSHDGVLTAGVDGDGKYYWFSYNPAETKWFWDYILRLRFSQYDAMCS